MIPNGKGCAQVLEASQWATDVDYETTQIGAKLRLRRGDLRRLLGQPFVELLLPDGSCYELLPSPPADVTFYALIIKRLRPVNFVR